MCMCWCIYVLVSILLQPEVYVNVLVLTLQHAVVWANVIAHMGPHLVGEDMGPHLQAYMGPHLQALICFLEDPNLIFYFTVKMIFFVNLLYWLNKWLNKKKKKKILSILQHPVFCVLCPPPPPPQDHPATTRAKYSLRT